MGRRDQQREETRRKLYETALASFRARGVGATSIEEIAAAAGVSRGTFYFHYPTKEDVLLQLLQESQQGMAEQLDELPDAATLPEVLDQVADLLAAQWRDDASLLASIGMVALTRATTDLANLDAIHPVHGALSPRFAAAATRGEIGDLIPPELLTQFFLANLFGAALAWCGNPVVPLDALLRSVVVFFLRATRPEAT